MFSFFVFIFVVAGCNVVTAQAAVNFVKLAYSYEMSEVVALLLEPLIEKLEVRNGDNEEDDDDLLGKEF